ncbi:MAG: hypothetical protein AAGB48_04640 [Planctomycetota bacterium]
MIPSEQNDDQPTGARQRRRARRKPAVEATTPSDSIGRIVLLDPSGDAAAWLEPALLETGLTIERVARADHALGRLNAERTRTTPTVLIACAEGPSDPTLDVVGVVAAESPAAVSIVTTASADVELAVEAMRRGAADLISADQGAAHARRATIDAVEKAADAGRRESRVERLRAVCRRLNDARQQITSQVSGMCNDLMDAYEELSDQIDTLAVCAEFNGVIRQELDIESLLRVVLEYLLAKVGPTNAAVFLPASSHEFSLGAYVNCDLDRGTLDMLLDHLADALAPRFEDRPGLHVFQSRHETTKLLGDDRWLSRQCMAVFPCHRDDECLAVVALFRDDDKPFAPEDAALLETISALFAAQLARIIHVHHRHLPKHQWGALGDEPDDWTEADDLDQAA